MSARRAFTVELTEEQIEEIEAHVASGAYSSAGEVVAAGVAELSDRDWNSPEMQAVLDDCDDICRRIDAGTESLHTLDEVMAGLDQMLRDRQTAERSAAE